jgi:hypothetical protein
MVDVTRIRAEQRLRHSQTNTFRSAVNRLNVAVGDARRFSLAATVKF